MAAYTGAHDLSIRIVWSIPNGTRLGGVLGTPKYIACKTNLGRCYKQPGSVVCVVRLYLGLVNPDDLIQRPCFRRPPSSIHPPLLLD